ncbi:capsular biosynthesis protein [Xanthobacter sediminis]
MIVFPMAGLSSRFTRAGYDRPKWMLPLAERPLLDWSLLGFRELFDREPFLLVYLDTPGVAEFVRERAATLGIRDVRFVPLTEPTRGQAETVQLGIDGIRLEDDEAITIFNIDTIRPGFRHAAEFQDCAGWLECFEGEGEHWSFVKPGANQRADDVSEKKRISNLCCTGLYNFSSAKIFRDSFEMEKINPGASELYVAPMYRHIIRSGLIIKYRKIDIEQVFFSGTPDEYEALKKNIDNLLDSFRIS